MSTSLRHCLVALSFCLLTTLAAFAQINTAPATADLNITLGEQRVRFAPARGFQEMRLEVTNQSGETVFSHLTAEAEFEWNQRSGDGEMLAPGLYSYVLTLTFGEDQTHRHRGHFIVEKGQDQVWLTAQDGAEVSGAAFNVTRTGGRSVAGLGGAGDKAVKRDMSGREIVDEKGNKLTEDKEDKKAAKQEKAALLGTTNRVAKFGASGLADTDSNIHESFSGHLGFGVDSSATTPLLFNGDLNAGLGASLPALILQSQNDHARLEMRSAGAGAPIVQGRAASGTLGAPGATPANQIMGGFGGSGHDGQSFAQFSSGFIGIKAGQLWTPGAKSAYLTFETTPNNSTTRIEAMRITGDGNVGIGTTTPDAALHATSSASNGVHGVSTANGGYGVYGQANTGPAAAGVFGSSISGYGVVGFSSSATGAGVRAAGSGATGTALRIDNGGIKVTGAGIGTSTPVFVHRATAANIVSVHTTVIDHPLTNGDPNAILIVTQNFNPGGVGGISNNRGIGVFYHGNKAQWTIYNQDAAAMPVNAAFNVLVIKP